MDINHKDIWEEIEKKLNEYFSDPKNVEDFRKSMNEELKKPYYTHLGCMEPCEYCMPKDADMGTIMWCDKYLVGQEELCDKECGKRWTYEPIIGPVN